jgi:hypothetical protein
MTMALRGQTRGPFTAVPDRLSGPTNHDASGPNPLVPEASGYPPGLPVPPILKGAQLSPKITGQSRTGPVHPGRFRAPATWDDPAG